MRFLFNLLLLPILAFAANNPVLSWRSNGVDVWFVQSYNLPMLDIALVFDAGSVREGKHYGLARLTSDMLFTGCAGMSESDIARVFEANGAIVNSSMNYDYASISLKVLTDEAYFKPVMNVIGSCLKQPDFKLEPLKKNFSILSDNWQESQKDPLYLAFSNIKKQFYHDHAYGRFTNVRPEIMQKNSLAEISNFYYKHYNQSTAKLIIVGDLSIAKAKKLAGKITDNLAPGKKLPKLSKPAVYSASNASILLPNQVQDTVVIALPGLASDSKDSLLVELGNYPLASGDLTSRLMQEVRDRSGYTYSISGLNRGRKYAGEYYIIFRARPTVMEKALQLTKNTFSNYLVSGASHDELRVAKKYMLNAAAMRRASNSGIVADLVTVAGLDLGLPWYNSYKNRILAANLLSVNSAFSSVYSNVKPIVVKVSNDK